MEVHAFIVSGKWLILLSYYRPEASMWFRLQTEAETEGLVNAPI